jgi:peptide/nickel transport system substrate-binding protein
MSSSSFPSTTPRSRNPRPGFIGVAVAAGSLLVLSSCSVANSEPSTGSDSADLVRIVLSQEPPTLEPCEANLTSTGVVVRSNITEPLVERNPTTGDLDPLLATAWEATGDTEWTFTLRDDVTFQDGSPFNAEAAAFAIDRAVNSDLGCNVEGYVFGDDDLEVTAVDETTLTVSTASPDPILPLRLSFVEIVPTSTDTAAKVREPVGTGPYAVKQWDAGTKLTLERNADYWGDAPAYAEAEYQWRAEGTVRAAMVTSGEADLAMGLGADDGAGDLGLDYPNNETVALRLTAEIPPLDDIRVRQAINYAIDKQGITDSLYQGAHIPAAQLVPEGIVGHNPDLDVWEFDVAAATALVDEARADGVPVDEKITMVARNAQFPKVSEMSQVLQEQLSQIGLNVELKMVDTTQHLQYQLRPFVTNEGPIALLIQHGNQAGDAAFSVEQYMTTTGAQSVYGTPEFDTMLTDAGLLTGDDREAAYQEIFGYQNEDIVQFAFIAHQTGVIGKAATVGYEPNSSSGDELRLAEITPAG